MSGTLTPASLFDQKTKTFIHNLNELYKQDRKRYNLYISLYSLQISIYGDERDIGNAKYELEELIKKLRENTGRNNVEKIIKSPIRENLIKIMSDTKIILDKISKLEKEMNDNIILLNKKLAEINKQLAEINKQLQKHKGGRRKNTKRSTKKSSKNRL